MEHAEELFKKNCFGFGTIILRPFFICAFRSKTHPPTYTYLWILAVLGLVAEVEQKGFGASSRMQVANLDERRHGVTVAERLHR